MSHIPSHRGGAGGGFVFAAAVCLLLIGGGCSYQPPEYTADGRVIVRYWEKWTGFEGDAMRAIVDDFNASQDRIHVEMLTVSQIDHKLMLATSGGNPPDVSGLWSHSINVYAEKGALTPLNSLLTEAGITKEDYIPVFWDLCAHRGFMWALPSTPATMALHWNKRLFREAGLDPEQPPRSIEELERMNEQLTVVRVPRDGRSVTTRYAELTDEEKAAKQFEIVRIGHVPTEPGWWTPMWGFWFGGELWDGDRRITTTAPEHTAAFTWFQRYPEKYGLDNLRTFGASLGTFSSPQNAFLTEQVAMVLQGVWMYNFIDKFAPHIEWGVAPFPSIDPDALQAVTIVECDVLVIPRGARRVNEAFEFIRYVNTQPVMEKLVLGQRKFSPLAETSPGFVKQHPNPFIQVFMDLARSPNARYEPRLTVWNEYRGELVVAADRIFSLRISPEDALNEVKDRVQWKYDRILRRWDIIREARMEEWGAYDTR